MNSNFESCRAKLEELRAWYEPRAADRNEATTRLQLIDRFFFECLGWDREDAVLEESHAGEYADYTFTAPRRLLIVEAKREGAYFELAAGETRPEHSLKALARDYPSLRAAIEQAAGYCQARGVPFAAVTNGHQTVAFVAVRTDGIPPLEGRCLVFASFEAMLENFRQLWDALSKPGIERKLLAARVIGDARQELAPKLAVTIGSYPGIKGRNIFQTDLQIVSEVVLEDLSRSRELEPRFLEECYCRTGALSQYALTSKAILQARYAALFESGDMAPTTVAAVDKHGVSAELVAESLSRRPILLIGDVGVGKTIFIRHLIKVDAAQLFVDAITLYIDFGSQATLTADLRRFILDEISRQLEAHGVDIEERNFVRAVYHLDLIRFQKGIYGDLKESDPAEYQRHELEFLGSRISRREEHLRASVEHIAKGRKKQVVLFIDNCDQRDDETQQQAFLIAQEFGDRWPLTVFLTLRPETFHRSLRAGALTGYHPKAFTISPPRIDLVIQRRLSFGLKLTSGEIPLEALGGGTRLRLDKLDKILHVFLSSLSDNEQLAECIDNMAAGNVRVALDLVKGFFGSGHVDTEKIIKLVENGGYSIPVHEFLRAAIYGDYIYYDPARSPIANLFDVSSFDAREHFILSYLISLLMSAAGPGVEEGFVETDRVYERLQAAGFTPDQIDSAVLRAHSHKLIEAAGRRIPTPGGSMPNALRVTTVGLYHVSRLVRMFTYVDAIIVDTPILDQRARERIHDVPGIAARLERTEVFRSYLDDCWATCIDIGLPFSWTSVSADLKGEMDRVQRSLTRDR